MGYEVKRISTAGIAEAIAKAELYRSLNEPEEAESICRDILTIEPQHQLALRFLGLALTDQFAGRGSDRYYETEDIFRHLEDPYERLYYTGLLYERRAKAMLKAGQPPRSLLAFFDQALRSFAEAEKIRPAGNDDAILRWESVRAAPSESRLPIGRIRRRACLLRRPGDAAKIAPFRRGDKYASFSRVK